MPNNSSTKQKRSRRNTSWRKSRQAPNRAPANNFFEKEDRVQTLSPLDEQVIHMTKIVEASNIVTSTTVNTFPSYFFTFSQIADYTELAGVFDQYRIDRVDARIVPAVTENLSSTAVIGRNYSAIDLDDSNAFTSMTDPLDYSNALVWEVNDPMQISFVPHFAYGAFAAGVFSSFANSPPRWIDCASPGVQHYGLKLAMSSVNAAITYTVQFRLHISLRMMH